MESYYALPECILCYERAMDILHMLLEDTEKNIQIRECQNVVIFFLLTADSERWKHIMEHNGKLAVHILYIMYQWKSRSSEQLKDSLPSLPDVLQHVQILTMLLYTVHYKNRSYIPISFKLQELVHMIHLQDMHWMLQQLARYPGFTVKA
jgi:hypothetical protein